VLSPTFVAAVDFAIRAHGGQRRKGGNVTYVAHLLAVAALVLEAGGDEDTAIAGLLHDVLEDTATTSADVEAAFGRRVTAIVEGCTEVRPAPWRERKETFLARLRAPGTSAEVLVVARADKLHNARSMLQEYRAGVGGIFSAGPDEQRWYYQALAEVFGDRLPGPITEEFRRTVHDLSIVLAGS
jgi:(p)ppGpp synthase/HD superfamily hydrolase